MNESAPMVGGCNIELVTPSLDGVLEGVGWPELIIGIVALPKCSKLTWAKPCLEVVPFGELLEETSGDNSEQAGNLLAVFPEAKNRSNVCSRNETRFSRASI